MCLLFSDNLNVSGIEKESFDCKVTLRQSLVSAFEYSAVLASSMLLHTEDVNGEKNYIIIIRLHEVN